jgi:hypothetical protein
VEGRGAQPDRSAEQQPSSSLPPPPPGVPEPPLLGWLRISRPAAEPGVWRCGHVPRPPDDPDRVPTRRILSGALLCAFVAYLLGWILWEGYLGDYWWWPFLVLIPDDVRGHDFVQWAYFYWALWWVILAVIFGRLGQWPELVRRAVAWARRRGQPVGAPLRPRNQPVLPPHLDPAAWPELRAAGASEAADRLTAEARSGAMNDVDHARIAHAWTSVQQRPELLERFAAAVRRDGAAAMVHGSGARDLPTRTAHHDLTIRQVRIGVGAESERTPAAYRGAGIALTPALLGTSALLVGPPPVVSARLVQPVVESLSLQSLTGQACVVSVAAAGTAPLSDSAYDVVIRPGQPGSSTHGFDLYGGTSDPDVAAGMVAEALVGDQVTALPGGDSRRAATVLAQLLGPYHAVHGTFPTVRALRDLLDGSRPALDALRAELAGRDAQTRDLDAYERQAGQPVCGLLAERVALLDRPAFEGVFAAESASTTPWPFSLRAIDRPVRVRIDLPERGHAEASRIIARLVLAQFVECALDRQEQTVFACLVLADGAQTITPQSLRGLQRLRSAHAGVVVALPHLADVPGHLRGPLLGTVGCRLVCAGVTPWDGEVFAEAWGIEWVETRTVTNHEIRADEPTARAMHAMRRLVTGKAVTRESVTVAREQRQRWSASDLANELPVGHAVVSVTTVAGERTPPILIKITD